MRSEKLLFRTKVPYSCLPAGTLVEGVINGEGMTGQLTLGFRAINQEDDQGFWSGGVPYYMSVNEVEPIGKFAAAVSSQFSNKRPARAAEEI